MTTTAAPPVATVSKQSFLTSGMLIVIAIALAKLLLHCFFNNRYAYFRDEFDYIACGRHMAWGYVDQPPLVPFLTRISIGVLADLLPIIRFVPILFSSATLVLTTMIY